MRVLQVCSSHNQFLGGAERFCLSLSESLSTSDIHLMLLTGSSGTNHTRTEDFSVGTIPDITNLWLRKFGFDYVNLAALSAFRSHVQQFFPDIIHFHNVYGLPTALARAANGFCPVVVTLHDAWLAFTDASPLEPKFNLANTYLKVPHGYVHRVLNRFFLRNATLVSPSHWLLDFFTNAGFNSPVHIPNGLTDKGCITRYEKIVLWVGALTSFKGLPQTIGYIAPLLSRLGWRFVVIGDGPEKNELELKYPTVEFLGYQDPSYYYESASILVVSSLGWENFPTVILEAMRHGLCVVGHNVGGIPELVNHNHNGLLYQNEEMLNEYLDYLTSNENVVRNFGRIGRKQFINQYLLETCKTKYLDLYQSLIETRATDQPISNPL